MRRLKLSVVIMVALGASAGAWAQETVPRPTRPVAEMEAQAAREPNNQRLLLQLGAAYFYQARAGEAPALEKAIASLERSVTLSPEDLTARRSLGLVYLMKVGVLPRQTPPQEIRAAIERALTTFERVLERAPADPAALSLHGSTLTFLSAFK